MQHIVGKRFKGGGEALATGQVVDTSSWADHRVEQLEAQRFLVPPRERLQTVTCDCGRTWRDEDAMHAAGHEFADGQRDRYEELKLLSRGSLLDRAGEHGLEEDDIQGSGAKGYVKRADIIQAILEQEN